MENNTLEINTCIIEALAGDIKVELSLTPDGEDFLMSFVHENKSYFRIITAKSLINTFFNNYLTIE